MSLLKGEVYRHFKGGRYLALLLATTHEHNGDLDVVYIQLDTGEVNTRALHADSRPTSKGVAWCETVEWPDGARRDRFWPENMLSPEELAQLEPKWAAMPKRR